MGSMRKWLRRAVVAALATIVLLAITTAGWFAWHFHPMSAFGRGIGNLPREEQIAYLILIDQADAGGLRKRSTTLPMVAYTSEDRGCPALSPGLKDALVSSSVFSSVALVASDCDALEAPFIFAAIREERLMGGVSCGGLCGGGHIYAVTEVFGELVIYRLGTWIS